MSRLTRTSMMTINKILEDSYCTSACFDVQYPDNGDNYIIITFVDYPGYYFHYMPDSNNAVEYCPGQYFDTVYLKNIDFSQCVEQIKIWIDSIRSELSTAHIRMSKEHNELQNEFNKAINDLFITSESVFSKDEIEHLKKILDDLYEKFESLRTDNTMTEDELSKIKTVLEGLKGDTEKFPKKSWFRAAGNNIFKFTGKFMSSPVGQKIIEEGTQKLLKPPTQ